MSRPTTFYAHVAALAGSILAAVLLPTSLPAALVSEAPPEVQGWLNPLLIGGLSFALGAFIIRLVRMLAEYWASSARPVVEAMQRIEAALEENHNQIINSLQAPLDDVKTRVRRGSTVIRLRSSQMRDDCDAARTAMDTAVSRLEGSLNTFRASLRNAQIQTHDAIIASIKGFTTDLDVSLEDSVKSLRAVLATALYVRPHLIADPGETTEYPSIESHLQQLNAITKRDLALTFAVDSIRQIRRTGFVQLEVDAEEYASFLAECCEQETDSVWATCTVRPLWFFDGPHRTHHLNHFRTCSAPTKVRLVALRAAQVHDILIDLLRNLVSNNSGIETRMLDVPEAIFFASDLAGCPSSFRVYWALEEGLTSNANELNALFAPLTTPHGHVPDYAAFGEDFVLKYEFLTNGKGHMSLVWGDACARHRKALKRVFAKDHFEGETYDAWDESVETLKPLRVWRSFRQLLRFEREELEAGFDKLAGGRSTVIQDPADSALLRELGYTNRGIKHAVLLDDGFIARLLQLIESGDAALRVPYVIAHRAKDGTVLQAAELSQGDEWRSWLESRSIASNT